MFVLFKGPLSVLALTMFITISLKAQSITQAVSGNIVDQESNNPLQVANVVVIESEPTIDNEKAVASARAFTVEETKRYAAAVNDPLRMATSYAGVVTGNDGSNEIAIRGNSPTGLLWRMEGIDIPNPNHFSAEGSTGGPINALSSKMLSNSDFFTGAFAPEYGDATSGVFDMKLKGGNNERREYTAIENTTTRVARSRATA